jgi:DNA-binding XRE family transcriptional regulator
MQDTQIATLHLALRRARQAANLRQGELAKQVGCTQSALSMYEGGKATALAQETVRKLAETLGVALPAGFGEEGKPASAAPLPAVLALPGAGVVPVRFCPNFQCLSNLPYSVGGQTLFLPLAVAGGAAHCAVCGELLEKVCPACGAPVLRRGGCCGECGAPLVVWPEGFAEDPSAWIAAQRAAISDLGFLPLR